MIWRWRRAGEAPAAGLVRLLAFLAPEPVPLALLLAGDQAGGRLGPEAAAAVRPLLGDPVAAGDAVAALRRFSLVTPAGDGLVLVHRLVQAITRAQLTAEAAGQWEQAAAALDLTSSGIWRIAQYLGVSGSYPPARDLSGLTADAHRESDAYGAEHRDTLVAHSNLAYWTGGGGRRSRGPRPDGRPAAHQRTGPGPRAPRHPGHP